MHGPDGMRIAWCGTRVVGIPKLAVAYLKNYLYYLLSASVYAWLRDRRRSSRRKRLCVEAQAFMRGKLSPEGDLVGSREREARAG